jgi:hypothetical protein
MRSLDLSRGQFFYFAREVLLKVWRELIKEAGTSVNTQCLNKYTHSKLTNYLWRLILK